MTYDSDANVRLITYKIRLLGNYKKDFTTEEKAWCRPIAETLAMLDGNAVFGTDLSNGREWYESYLPEAWEVFMRNGGATGWPAETSWMKDIMHHESPAVEEAYKQWRVLKSLSK